MEWTQDQVFKLIEEYRERPQLWNSKFPEYSDKNLRQRHLEELSFLFETDIETIRNKIYGLRTQYLSEQKKVLDSLTSGSGNKLNTLIIRTYNFCINF